MQFLPAVSNAFCEQEEVTTTLTQLATINKTKICIYLLQFIFRMIREWISWYAKALKGHAYFLQFLLATYRNNKYTNIHKQGTEEKKKIDGDISGEEA